ncbi:hypothetical protein [Scytonema hofmannii]|nr:hypothetical protein [Scytonema hofmannii]
MKWIVGDKTLDPRLLKGYSWRMMGLTPHPNDFIGVSRRYSECDRVLK